MEGDEASLLLRFKARTGDPEASVVGQVFESILQLEGAQGVSFVAGFLQSGAEAVREEAALSLGASRMPRALSALEEAWEATRDPDLRVWNLARAERLPAGRGPELLARSGAQCPMLDATAALEALSLHGESAEIRKQAQEAVEERGAD